MTTFISIYTHLLSFYVISRKVLLIHLVLGCYLFVVYSEPSSFISDSSWEHLEDDSIVLNYIFHCKVFLFLICLPKTFKIILRPLSQNHNIYLITSSSVKKGSWIFHAKYRKTLQNQTLKKTVLGNYLVAFRLLVNSEIWHLVLFFFSASWNLIGQDKYWRKEKI